VKEALFTLKKHAGRSLGILAICATAAAVPLAIGSGTPAGAQGGGCHVMMLRVIPHGHGDFSRTIYIGLCK